MKHGHAETTHHGGGDSRPIRFGPPDAAHAHARQKHAERHKPRTRALVAGPAEQGLDHGRDNIRAEHQHHGLGIAIAARNQKGQNGRKRALIDVRAHVAAHGQVVRKFVAVSHALRFAHNAPIARMRREPRFLSTMHHTSRRNICSICETKSFVFNKYDFVLVYKYEIVLRSAYA